MRKPIGSDHPAWRETVRIFLLDLALKAVSGENEATEAARPGRLPGAARRPHSKQFEARVGAVLRRLFKKQEKFLVSTGDAQVAFEMGAAARTQQLQRWRPAMSQDHRRSRAPNTQQRVQAAAHRTPRSLR